MSRATLTVMGTRMHGFFFFLAAVDQASWSFFGFVC
jgi:hypothetical protein